jgi:hypothetical protein
MLYKQYETQPDCGRVLRLRIKDKHARVLADMARAVNFVWNYCADLSLKVLQCRARFRLIAESLERFTHQRGLFHAHWSTLLPWQVGHHHVPDGFACVSAFQEGINHSFSMPLSMPYILKRYPVRAPLLILLPRPPPKLLES